MTKYKHHKRLDDILTFIIKKEAGEFPAGINTIEELDEDFKSVIDKLVRDKIIITYKNSIGYIATFEGKILHEKGGYVNKEYSKTVSIAFKFAGAIAVAVGTIGILIWEIWKYYNQCPCNR